MTKLRIGSGRNRKRMAGLGVMVGLLAVGIGVSGSATAAPDAEGVLCGGKLTFNKPNRPSSLLHAQFTCNKDIKTWSLITNAGVDFFHSESVVLKADGTPSGDGEGFDCEGPIPGWGFGCRKNGSANGALADSTSTQDIGIFRNPCGRKARKRPLLAWVTVAYDRLKPTDMSVFLAQSEPFRLQRPKCPPLPARASRKG